MAESRPTDVQAVHRFCQSEGWQVDAQVLSRQMLEAHTRVDPSLGPLREYATGWGRFTVSTRGSVTQWNAPPIRNSAAGLDEAAALSSAGAFLERHVPDAGSRYTLASSNRLAARFKFMYDAVLPAGAVSMYPNFLQITVEGGSVQTYLHEDLDLVRYAPLGYDEPAARRRVLELTGGVGLNRASVSEVPLPDGRAVSVWDIEVFHEGMGPSNLGVRNFRLHADSGEPYEPPA